MKQVVSIEQSIVEKLKTLTPERQQQVLDFVEFLQNKMPQQEFRHSQEIDVVDELMKRYQSVPMSLADACLVKMAELSSQSELLTLDSYFKIYRKNKNQLIYVIIAGER